MNIYMVDGMCFFNKLNPKNMRCEREAAYETIGELSTEGWQWCAKHARKTEHCKIEKQRGNSKWLQK